MSGELIGILLGVWVFVIMFVFPIILIVLHQKRIINMKQTCSSEKFELVDILFILEKREKNKNRLKKVFVMRLIESDVIYFANVDDRECFSNIATTCRMCFDTASGMKVVRRDRDKGNVNLSIGDKGICYIQNISPFELTYISKASIDPNDREYGQCVYAGSYNKNKTIRLGEYCNCNESENVIENLQDLKQIKGLIEFDEF